MEGRRFGDAHSLINLCKSRVSKVYGRINNWKMAKVGGLSQQIVAMCRKFIISPYSGEEFTWMRNARCFGSARIFPAPIRKGVEKNDKKWSMTVDGNKEYEKYARPR